MNDKWKYLVITLNGIDTLFHYRGPIEVDWDVNSRAFIVHGFMRECFTQSTKMADDYLWADKVRFVP